VAADSKNYSPNLFSRWMYTGTLWQSRKVREKRAEKDPRHLIPPSP
jgi:hypothetical protein